MEKLSTKENLLKVTASTSDETNPPDQLQYGNLS